MLASFVSLVTEISELIRDRQIRIWDRNEENKLASRSDGAPN
jgi:hypothetical protein